MNVLLGFRFLVRNGQGFLPTQRCSLLVHRQDARPVGWAKRGVPITPTPASTPMGASPRSSAHPAPDLLRRRARQETIPLAEPTAPAYPFGQGLASYPSLRCDGSTVSR
ncbi:MAG: hypothetical protein PHF72_12880 [Gammaproteobacteria bacterium]|nr:hypothetical protein [Gammaproteobacteria bacterium]